MYLYMRILKILYLREVICLFVEVIVGLKGGLEGGDGIVFGLCGVFVGIFVFLFSVFFGR